MTKILTEESIRHTYERKKASCEERSLNFNIGYEYYKMLMRSRSAMVCFYTGKPFDLRDSNSDNYPTLERLENGAYTEEGTVLCSRIANSVKNEYIESGKGMVKGMGEKQVRVYRSIEKVLNQPDLMNERLKPYQELRNKVQQREQEKEAKEQVHKANVEACEKVKRINAAKAKADEQLTLSKHYTAIHAAFEGVGLIYDVSIKVHRDIFRKQYCALTGAKFESMMDKFFWIPDHSKIKEKGVVSKGDFIVTTVDAASMVDSLKKYGNLKTVAINILKNV